MTEEKETPLSLRRMRKCLMANRCVSFTVGNRGRRTAAARFLNARLVLATGPLAMAWNTGATLLPVFTLRKAPGQFEVTIGAPIELRENADGEADYAAALQSYADVVTPFVLRDPGQWRGWRYTRTCNLNTAESAREHSSLV
jgi:lauroyl/myristoyl acyltransferase